MKDEALRLALEALERVKVEFSIHQMDTAITALREALAQPQQEPVATVVEHLGFVDGIIRFYGTENMEQLPVGTMLYTSPPAQRKPLTDEEIESMWIGSVGFLNPMLNQHTRLAFARAIEAAHGIKE